MNKCLNLKIISIAFIGLISSQLVIASDFRFDFAQSFYQSCYVNQRASLVNSGVPERLVTVYCRCSANNLLTRLNNQDLININQSILRNVQVPLYLRQMFQSVGTECMTNMINNMSPAEIRYMDNLQMQGYK